MDIILDTPRLTLRPLALTDFDTVHSYGSSPENVRYMIWGPNNADATMNFLRDTVEKNNADNRTYYDFAIVLKEINHHIGSCGLYLRQKASERNGVDSGEAMLGWILHRDFWRHGYCAEAAKAMLDFGFGKLGLHRIYATCNADNYGSYRVMEKIGMRREAHFVKNRFGRVGDSQVWFDEYHYAILRYEWESQTEKQ